MCIRHGCTRVEQMCVPTTHIILRQQALNGLGQMNGTHPNRTVCVTVSPMRANSDRVTICIHWLPSSPPRILTLLATNAGSVVQNVLCGHVMINCYENGYMF